MVTKPLPSKNECNLGDPSEHFLWALRNMPVIAGSGAVTHPGILREWSKHLWAAGFRHRDTIAELADEDGKIDVKDLPEQEIEFHEAFRGPNHIYNNAARWAKKGEPQPKLATVPNIREMTIQERYALAYMLKQDGVVIPDDPQPSKAVALPDGKPS